MKAKQIFWLFICIALPLSDANSFFGAIGRHQGGSLRTFLGERGSAVRTKTITNSYHESGIGAGTVIDNVNLFNGAPSFSIPLGAISAAGKVSFPINLGYGGNVREMVRADNDISPTSVVGLGWNLGVNLSVSVNHKGTLFTQDDVFYAGLGAAGGGQIIQDKAGRFIIATNPFIRITYDTADAGSLKGQIESWTFEVPGSGIKYVFGKKDSIVSNSERIQYHTKGLVRLSSFKKDSAQPFIYKWDLSRIVDAEGRNEILFEYQKTEDTLFGSKAYTRESHLKSVQWLDRRGGEAKRWEFVMANKVSGEYYAGDPGTPRYDMTPFETKYLSSLEQYFSGIKDRQIDFHYTVAGSGYYKKRFLDSLVFSDRLGVNSSAFIKSRPWKMEYAHDSLFKVLSKVTDPSGASTEFQYEPAPFGVEAQQDVSTDTLKDMGGSVRRLPDTTGKYQNLSSCSERFCYMAFDTSGSNGWMYLNVFHNQGNYFDRERVLRVNYMGLSLGLASSDWRYFPFEDDLYVYDGNDTDLYVWRWDGLDWGNKFMGFGSFGADSRGMEIHPSLNYMIVAERSPTKTKTWVMLRQDTNWVDVNAGSCVVGNDSVYGESVKAGGDGCMVWDGPVKVRVSGNLFFIIHEATDIIYAYQLNPDGKGFTEVSNKFVGYSGEFQPHSAKNNWNKDIKDLSIGQDFILVRSEKGGSPAKERVDVFHFDGYTFRGVDSTGWENAGPIELRTYLSGDYFLIANHNSAKHDIRYWKKVVSGDSLYFSKTQVRDDLPDTSSCRLLVNTDPVAFAVEYARKADSVGGGSYKPLIGGGSNYQSYLYQIDPDTVSGFRDRSQELLYAQQGIAAKSTNVRFSASDNMFTALNFRKAGTPDSLCADADPKCSAYALTAKLNRLAAGNQAFVYRDTTYEGIGDTTKGKYFVVAHGGRIGSYSLIQQHAIPTASPQHFLFLLNAFDGNDYLAAPDSVKVVSTVIRRSGMGPAKLDMRTRFAYGQREAEYNAFAQTPMFDSTAVKRTDSVGNALSEARYFHKLDLRYKTLRGKNLNLNGALQKTLSYDRANHLVGAQEYFHRPDSNIVLDSLWPSMVSLTQMDSTVSMDISPNGSMMTQKVSYHSYSTKNGQPRFTKQQFAEAADTGYLVSQTVFNDTGLVKEQYGYHFTINPPDDTLNGKGDVRYDTLNAISASKVEYSVAFPYLLAKDSLWRDTDERFSDDSLKKGVEPIFNLKQGWLPLSRITQRDSLNLVEETQAIKDTTDTTSGSGVYHTSMFYEGKYSQVAGAVGNSRLKNCALLLGENGSMSGLTKHDFEGRWDMVGSTFSAVQAHTGSYSIKVVDNYGPTTNLVLDSVRKESFGFVFSAWIYAESGVTPVLTVERRSHLNALVDVFYGNPVDGAIKRRRWQRWEVKLTHAQLIANNLFNGNPDYLRIWVGTGDPASQSTRIVYVDDLVARPDNSTFNLTTYDYRGLPSSTTDTHHLTRYVERDFLGQGAVIREERFRTYGQSSVHRLGENP